MSESGLPPLRSPLDLERVLEFEFVRATENAALNSIKWMGRGDKERADAAACEAIYGVFDLLDIRGEVVIGEGIKDRAPGIFLGDRLGTWKEGAPKFDIALDPIDGTTNMAKGQSNSISVIAAAQVPESSNARSMRHIPSFYSSKMAYGPKVRQALDEEGGRNLLDEPLAEVLRWVAQVLDKNLSDLVVMTMDRPRHDDLVWQVRRAGAGLRMVGDGDITAAVAPSMLGSGVDMYIGIGGSPEGVLTAAALKCLGGDMQMRMWFPNERERDVVREVEDVENVFRVNDLILGDSALFCATGISDSALLPGVTLTGHQAETHSILMRARSGTVRRIHATHQLDRKVVPVRCVEWDLPPIIEDQGSVVRWRTEPVHGSTQAHSHKP